MAGPQRLSYMVQVKGEATAHPVDASPSHNSWRCTLSQLRTLLDGVQGRSCELAPNRLRKLCGVSGQDDARHRALDLDLDLDLHTAHLGVVEVADQRGRRDSGCCGHGLRAGHRLVATGGGGVLLERLSNG